MNATQAKRLVVVSVVVAAILAALAQLARDRELPGPRAGIGAFFAAVLLALLAEAAPQLAGALAALLLTSAVLTLGPDVLGAVNRLTTTNS